MWLFESGGVSGKRGCKSLKVSVKRAEIGLNVNLMLKFINKLAKILKNSCTE